mgnify:CR=1 FL=1
MLMFKERQITFGSYGHFLNHTQVFSPDGRWIAYDTRNDDSQIGSTGSIEMVNVDDGEVRLLYETQNQTSFGPGVGAVAFSPVQNRVVFIHGIRNANQTQPYGFTRRTGVAIDIDHPQRAIFLDARDIRPPFTAGALRGGTHAHSWSGDGEMICCTYNDFVMEQAEKFSQHVKDLRSIAVMFPEPVAVPQDETLENHSGEMFSVLMAKVTEQPKKGSDEIDKAFDECWLGTNGYLKADGSRQEKAIAFQGNVRTADGAVKTEVFVVDLPADLTKANAGRPLEGTENSRPNVPKGLCQRRLTYHGKGVQGPRHWLRSSPDGAWIYFLSKDPAGFINVFAVSTFDESVKQISHHQFNIQSGINLSPSGDHIAYVANQQVFITHIISGMPQALSHANAEQPIIGPVMWSPDGKMLTFNRFVKQQEGNFIQIFLLMTES